MKKNKRNFLIASILVLLCFLIIANFSKIKFIFSMVNNYIKIDNNSTKITSKKDYNKNNPLEIIINSNNEDEQESNYIEIISNYNSQFHLMRKDYEAKLDSLLKVGYMEYISENISRFKLTKRYINEGSRLEKESDSNFNNLLNEMNEVLQSNNYDTEIIQDLKKYYSEYKSNSQLKFVEKIKNIYKNKQG